MKPFNFIAYSRIKNDKGPVNTAEHYRYVGSLPFTSIKGDVRPTSDGGIIMCHDAGFTLDENGRVTKFDKLNNTPILEMTTAQCLALEHAKQYDGHYCKVVDVETYIRICKESGKAPFVTVRNEEIESVAPTILKLLEKYDLIESSVINSFTVSTLEIFRELCPEIRLSRVIGLLRPADRSDVDIVIKLQNCILNCFHFTSSDSTSGLEAMDASADAIAYAAANGVDVYQAQVSDEVDINYLIERGISGAQVLYAPTDMK